MFLVMGKEICGDQITEGMIHAFVSKLCLHSVFGESKKGGGVYLLGDRCVEYIGQTMTYKTRVAQHRRNGLPGVYGLLPLPMRAYNGRHTAETLERIMLWSVRPHLNTVICTDLARIRYSFYWSIEVLRGINSDYRELVESPT